MRPQGKFMLQQMVSIAELEAGLISARTKAALAEAKKRGVVLGGYNGRDFTAKDIKASVATRQAQAAQRASDLVPIVKELQASGATSLRAIAAGLNERSIPTARGGEWSATQVMRLLAALSRAPSQRERAAEEIGRATTKAYRSSPAGNLKLCLFPESGAHNSGHCWRTCMVVANNVQTRSNGVDGSGQPLVTMGGGALPLPMPTQPATLTATRVATKANSTFFIGVPLSFTPAIRTSCLAAPLVAR